MRTDDLDKLRLTPGNLRAIRLEHQWTVGYTAERLETARQTYKRWEDGQAHMPLAYQILFRLVTRSLNHDLSTTKPPDWSPEKIFDLRERLGLSQETFAENLQVTRRTVSAWERGYWQPGNDKQQIMDDLDRVK